MDFAPPGNKLILSLGFAAIFALGLGLGHFSPQSRSNLSKAVNESTPKESVLTQAQLLTSFSQTNWNDEQPQDLDVLSQAVSENVELRNAATKRLKEESQSVPIRNLITLLTAQPLPEIATLAITWTQSSDANLKEKGLRLLNRQIPTPQTYALVKQTFEQTKDPKVLASAIWALQFYDSILDPQEVEVIAPKLHALTQFDNDDVRSASIQKLAEWDKAQLYIEQDIIRLVSAEKSKDTLISAVGASSIASLHSHELKRAFFKLLEDPKTDDELRGVILWQIDRFALNPAEYKTYKKVVQELEQKASSANQ